MSNLIDANGATNENDVNSDEKTQADGGEKSQLVKVVKENVLLGPFPSFGKDSSHSLPNENNDSTGTKKDSSSDSANGATKRDSNNSAPVDDAPSSSDDPIGRKSPLVPPGGIDGISRYRRYSGPTLHSPIREDAGYAIAALDSSPQTRDYYDGKVSVEGIGKLLGRDVLMVVDSQQPTQLVNNSQLSTQLVDVEVSSSPVFADLNKSKNSSDKDLLDFDQLASSPVKKIKVKNSEEHEDDGDVVDLNPAFLAVEDSQLHKRKAMDKLKKQPGTNIQINDEGVVCLNIENDGEKNEVEKKEVERNEVDGSPSPSPSQISDSIGGTQPVGSNSQFVQRPALSTSAAYRWLEPEREVLGNEVIEIPNSQNSLHQSQPQSEPAVTQVLGTPNQDMRKSMRLDRESQNYSNEVITSDNDKGRGHNDEEVIASSPEVVLMDEHDMVDDTIKRGAETFRWDRREKLENETDEHDDDLIIPSKRNANGKPIRIPSLPQSQRSRSPELSDPSSPAPVHPFSQHSPNLSNASPSYSPSPSPPPPTETAVWAVWNKSTYYPALLLDDISVESLFVSGSAAPLPPLINVVFSDGDVTELSLDNVVRFDLQIGDKIKVDDDRKSNYEVVELYSTTPKEYDGPTTDNNWVGYNGVSFVRVQQTKSLQQRIIPIRLIYMKGALLVSYLNRRKLSKNYFTPIPLPDSLRQQPTSQKHDAITTTPTPATSTRGSFILANNTIPNTGLQGKPETPSFLAKAETLARKGIFSNCVFTISAIDDTEELQSLTNTIVKHGGIVLTNGLQELFVINYSKLEITYRHNSAAALTFGGVLARDAVRTAKYLESLALGWPCLSYKFISDSVSDGEFIRDWQPYLLSSGISHVLDQSHTSYNVDQFHQNWQNGLSLSDQFTHRKVLLGPSSILSNKIYLYNHDPKDNAILFLLMIMAPVKKLSLISSKDQAPTASILIDLGKKPLAPTQTTSSRQQLRQLKTSKWPPVHTITYNREWIIQCLINRRII